ncbi:MAG: glycosyltransferase [Candidatus Eisenbacteria bacterium]|nr:glycosyltransferase [Candidatus Eisenbacteria bacterium]
MFRAFALSSAAVSALCILAGAACALRRRARGTEPRAWPGVTCLKPVKGLDPGARENFEALLAQDYPGPLEFQFVVEAEGDAALPLLRELAARDPRVRVVVAGLARAGSQKLHNLAVAAGEVLPAAAAGAAPGGIVSTAAGGAPASTLPPLLPLVCSSDSDVRPGPGALRALVRDLLASGAAAMCAPVYYDGARDLASRAFQAFANSDLDGILAVQERIGRADTLIGGMYVLGAARLAAAGGYASLGPHISDDGALGMRLARLGGRVLQGGEAVRMYLPRARWREFLSAGHRWWLMMRVAAPGRFLLAVLLLGPAYGMGLFVLTCAAQPAAAWTPSRDPWAWLAGPGLALLHVGTTALVGRRCGPPGLRLGYAWLRPLVDAASVPMWWAALVWPRIRWRGHRYVVRANGFAERLEDPGGADPP